MTKQEAEKLTAELEELHRKKLRYEFKLNGIKGRIKEIQEKIQNNS